MNWKSIFERSSGSSSGEGDSSSFRGKSYSSLESKKESAWEKDYRSFVSPERVNQQDGLYNKVLKEFDDEHYEALKQMPDNTISFVQGYKQEMINKGVLTQEQYDQKMQSFKEEVNNFRQILRKHQRLLNEVSAAADNTGRQASHAFSQMGKKAKEILSYVSALAEVQQQEQRDKYGTYQPPEPTDNSSDED